MKVNQIVRSLNAVSRANIAWREAKRKYEAERAPILRRLMFEAAHNYMSVADIARAGGMSQTRVRKIMRENGLDPKWGSRVLSKTAAEALHANADALGIAPDEMDLASPLAYLPMGKALARSLEGTVSKVTDLETYDGTNPPMLDGKPVSGYLTKGEAVHDLHLRGGRLRYPCPVCQKESE